MTSTANVEAVKLTAYETQVLIGTSISGCNMPPDQTFNLKAAWARLYTLGLIDRTDGLAIATETGQARIAAMLSTLLPPSTGSGTARGYRYRSEYDGSWQYWPMEAWNSDYAAPYRERHPEAEPYSLVASAPPTTLPSSGEDGLRETGWLIELKPSVVTVPTWFRLGEEEPWTSDSKLALRFARKADAETYIAEIGWTECIATEHQWG